MNDYNPEVEKSLNTEILLNQEEQKDQLTEFKEDLTEFIKSLSRKDKRRYIMEGRKFADNLERTMREARLAKIKNKQ